MSKKLFYRIGEACKLLEIQPYVLRYWETEFPFLSPSKSKAGQRVYNERELEVIRRIKELLYEEGYTIAGAKKKIEGELASIGVDNAGSEPVKERKTGTRKTAKQVRADGPAALDTAPVEAPKGAGGKTSKGKTRKASSRRSKKPPPEAPAPVALDMEARQEIETLRSGVKAALSQTRSILELLAN